MKKRIANIGVLSKIFALTIVALLFNSSVKAQLAGGNTYPINGTQNAPTSFGTVADAFTYLNANGTTGTGTITLEIASGYAGENALVPVPPLTAYTGMDVSRPVVLKPGSGQTPTISTVPAANSAVIRFNGASYFTIDGSNNGTSSRNLTITTTSTTTTVRLVDLVPTATNSCKFITVKNVNLRGNSTTSAINTYAAIYLGSGTGTPGAALLTGNDSNLFQNNVIEAVRNGIFLRGTNTAGQYDKYNRVTGNTIGGTIAPGGSQNTTYFGGVATTAGIYLNSQQYTLIQGNTIRNSIQGNYYARGVHLDALTAAGAANKDITINANRIYNLIYNGTGGYADHGIRVQINNNTANNISITNNFISNIAGDGDGAGTFNYVVAAIQVASNAGSANSNAGVYIYHNSINMYDNGTQKLLTRTNLIATCIATETNITGGINVVNNILQNTYPASGSGNSKVMAYYSMHGTINPFIAVNSVTRNNGIFINGSNTTNMMARAAATDYSTFANWQATTADSNSKNVDAAFIDNIDLYTLNVDLNNAGLPVGVLTDIDGKSRSVSTPDIGGSEYVPPLYNAGLEEITGINTGCNLGSGSIKATLKNSGILAIPVGDTIALWYSVNGGSKVWDTIFISTAVPPADSLFFTFSTPYNFSTIGKYDVTVGLAYSKDLFSANDSNGRSVENLNCLNTTPFITDFENGPSGFTETGGWALGEPAKANINKAGSGKNAWVAETLSGQYTNNLRAYLYSPLFDFSTACQPSVSFLVRHITENNYDAMVLEATTDNVNWVKVTTITPGYNNTSANGPMPPPKWAGDNTNWTMHKADLTAFANAPLFQFRFAFFTDGSATAYDGVAVDSIALEFYPTLGNVSVLSGIDKDTAFIQAPYNFTSSASSAKGVQHQWYLDNVLVDTDSIYSKTWSSTGTFEVKYIASTCAESDTVIIPVTVVVPVGLPTIDFIASRYTAEVGETVKINSLTGNGVFNWQWIITPDVGYDYLSQTNVASYGFVGPLSSTTPNTELFFFLGDTYDVCLVAENVNGTDTLCKSDYLKIHNAFNGCSYSSVPFPTGKIYDSGMGGGDYSNSEDCYTSIEPDCADSIFVKLNALATETNGDYLRIYDGTETDGKPLWDINLYPNGLSGNLGSVLNLPATLTATSGLVTVRFTSNGATVGKGYELEFWTNTATQAPVASFTMPDTLCPMTNIVVQNTSATQGNTNYYWDVDGDGIDDYTSKNPVFAYSTPGTYQVRLIAENCIGTSAQFKTIVIQNPSSAPVTAFGSDYLNPAVGDRVNLFDSTPGCVQGVSWIISPNTFSYINGTGSSSKNPVLVFNAPGCYDVTLITWNGIGYDTLERLCYFNVKTICQPFVSQTNSDIGISRVKLNTIDNQSAAGTQPYTSYINTHSTVLVKGARYDLTMERTTTINTMGRKAWIDFNQDGQFDATELVASESPAQTQQFVASIVIPRNALGGYTRLRVGTGFSNSTINPCGSNFAGEFEDYRVILINDTIKPVITLTGANPMNIERGRGYTELGATATDNVDGNLTPYIVISGTIDTMKVGTYTISYDVTDSAGNIATTVIRTVNITPDVTAPDVTLNGNAYDTIIVFNSYNDPGAAATDIVDGVLTPYIMVTDNLDTSKVGTYTRIYSVTDSSGNTGTITRYIVVIDTAKPVIVLTGNNPLIWGVHVPYVDPGHTVIDNYNAGLTATITGSVNHNVVGTYFLNFDVTDSSGISATTVVREVQVVDTIKPLVGLLGINPVIVDVFTSYNESGATATDNYDTNLPAVSVVTSVDTAKVADYDLKYIVTDSSGNTSDTVIRTVKVVDRVAPVVIVHKPIVIERTQPKPSLADSVNYTDNYYAKGDLTLSITESIDVNVEGYYTVDYVVSDPSGNSSQVVQGVVIVTGATGILPPVVNAAAVNVYPNPARNTAYVSLNFIRETEVKISVFNMTGQKVIEVTPEGSFASKVVELNLENLAAGNYIIRVEGQDGVTNKKLIVAGE